MTNQQPKLFERILDEFKAGNPLFYLMGLFLLVVVVTAWVWQIVMSDSVIMVTPRVRHPTAEHIMTLTAQARLGGYAPVPLSTPKAAFFYHDQMFSNE